MNYDAFIAACQDHARSRAAVGTRSLYLADLGRWLFWCGEHKIDPTNPTQSQATTFRDELLKTLAANTVRGILTALSAMYASAINRPKPQATWNPWTESALPRPKQDKHGKTEAVKTEVAEAMVAVAAADPTPRGKRDYALLQILKCTSLRRESVATLEWANYISRPTGAVLRVKLKGGDFGEAELVEDAVHALNIWRAWQANGFSAPVTPYVFPAVRTVKPKPMAVTTVNMIVKARGTEVGHPHVHPHQFRAAYITTAFDAGVSLVDVQRAAHHADPATTLRYDRGQRGAGVAAKVAKFREKGKG